MASELEHVPTLPALDDRALRKQLHGQLVGLVNVIDATSIAHADDREGQARLAQIVDMLIRDLRLVRADIGFRCAEAFPLQEKGRWAGRPVPKIRIDGVGEVTRSAAGSWKQPDWDAIGKAIRRRAQYDPESGEVFTADLAVDRAVEMTLACTGRSNVAVGGVTALGLEMEDVARRDEARPNVSVPSLGDWDV